MIAIAPPPFEALEVFRTCVGQVRNTDLAGRLVRSENSVRVSHAAFVEAAANGGVHLLDSANFALPGISRDEAAALYSARLAGRGSSGRSIYESIRSAAQKCPMCGHRSVSTLDHYLPKAQFSALVVDPMNLIPCCSECNRLKSDVVATADGQRWIHPYFDTTGDQRWLRAEVVEGRPVALRFSVVEVSEWPAVLVARVRNQFARLGLGELYAAQAADEVSGVRWYLGELSKRGGRDAVGDYLNEMAESRARVQRNSWQAATYGALAVSDWYCSEGFAA